MPTTINDELTRIEGAKSDIATAIGGKGVTVPANAKIDDMADLIDAIQTGGGSPNLQSKSVSITTNGTTNVVADSGYDGLSSVEVGVNVDTYYNFIKGLFENTLTDVVIPDGVTSIRNYGLRGCSSAVTLTIPDSVTSIGDYACYNLTNLVTINGGSGLETINIQSFAQCPNLENVNLKSIKSIGSNGFQYCSKLTNIILPDNIHRVNGFSNTNITTFIVKATTPPVASGTTWADNTPIGNGNGYLYVPNANINDYKNAQYWTRYAARIKGWVYDSQGRIVDADDATNILVNADGTFYVEP